MDTTDRIAYSVKEAASALGVSEWMVREEIRTGRIDSVRLGTRILIPRRELERLVGMPDKYNTQNIHDTASTNDIEPEEA